jgi:para-nitrobenzyl esterase
LGIDGDGEDVLAALRAIPADKLVEGASAPEVLAGLSNGQPVIGVVGAILDGEFLIESPEDALAAGRQAMVPVIVGANNRDLGIGSGESKEKLFALFGPQADQAIALYDASGTLALEELSQQVLADRTLVEPSRHLANELARSGQPVWWYRFSYVAESQREVMAGTLHGLEIPYTHNIPSALVGEQVTKNDIVTARLASGYWVSFAESGDPNGGDRLAWPRHDREVDRLLHFTAIGPVVGPDPLKARLDLWEHVWRANRNPQ